MYFIILCKFVCVFKYTQTSQNKNPKVNTKGFFIKSYYDNSTNLYSKYMNTYFSYA